MARPWPIPHPLARCLVAVVIVLGGGQAALALPEGMVVQGGQLELQQLDANNALLRQGTGRAAADFNSFNIDAGQRLQILQPDASSTLLGRVLNGQITEIHGRLDANGRVLLINPAGVLVGPGGVVNTAAFTATTLHVDHQRFLQGGTVELKNLPGADPRASVINRGTINVSDGGFAALIAPNVVNDGLITARLGQIQLASGTAATLDISGDGLLSVALDPAIAGTITNNGSLRASHVRLGGGDAAVLAAATVQQNGLLEARSIGELLGGRITIEGQHISVGRGAVLDASGANGGGTILVGGSWQNSDPSVRQATTTTVESGAVLDASATDRGNGGTVVAWSDIHNPSSVTRVNGSLSTKGGPNGGDGGRIETSGRLLQVDGIRVSTLAPQGTTGEWLLDPYNITISTGTTANVTGTYTANNNDAVINNAALVAALQNNNITVYTGGGTGGQSGNITVSASISSNWSNSLTLKADNNIIINESIALANAGLDLQALGGSISVNAPLTSILFSAAANTGISQTSTAAINVTRPGSSSGTQGRASLSAGAGSDITLTSTSNNFGYDIWITNTKNASITASSGILLAEVNISGNLALTSAGNITQHTPSTSPTPTNWIRVSGTTSLTAGTTLSPSSTYLIQLDNATNNFAGAISASGNATDVLLNNIGATTLASINAAYLSVTAGGPVTDTGPITVSGRTVIAAGTNNDLTLDAANNFGSVQIISARDVTLNDINELYLVDSSISRNLSITAAGPINPAGIDFPVTVSGTTTLAAGTGNNIIFSNAGNAFTGAVSIISAKDVTITNSSSLTLGASTLHGALTVSANGITQSGAITQAAGTGATSLNARAGAITLSNAGNDFTGDVALQNSGAFNVTLADSNSLRLAASSVGTGTLTISAVGITQSGAIVQAAGAGTASFNAGTGVITLDHASNDFTGSVSLLNSGSANVTVSDINSLQLGASTLGAGLLSVSAVGITQSGAITQAAGAGTALFYVGSGGISLTNASNDFTGPVSLQNYTASNIAVTDSNALDLGYSTFRGAGTLSISAVGITQSARIEALDGGSVSFNAGFGSIALTQGNILLGPVALLNSGANNVVINNITSLQLATSTLGTGTLTISAVGITQSGAITQAASAGSSSFNGGSGAVELTHASNDLTGTVSASTTNGNAIRITDSTTLRLGTVSAATGTGSVGGEITITANDINAAGGANSITTTGDILLQPLTTTTTIGVATSGAGIAMELAQAVFNSAITNGARSITIGRANQSGAITIGAVTFRDPTTIQSPSGSITVTGVITGSGDAGISLAASALGINLASNILTTDNAITLNSPVTLGANTTLTGSTITLGSTVNGSGYALNLTGNAIFNGALSSLSSLTVSGTSTSAINAASITTTGNQSYGGPITLGANTTLTGSNITLGSTVNGSGYSLTLTGNAIFTDNLSSFSSLAVSGTSTINAASITTTGNQSYSGLVTLGNANATLTGSTPTFTTGIAGAGKDLTLNFSGTTALSGSLFTSIANLYIGNAGQTTLSGALTTSGSQTYNNPISLAANTTLTGPTITLGSTVNGGGYSLTLTGNAIFNGSLSGLSLLDVSGTSTINAASITTTGNQSYTGAITLLSNTALSSTTGSAFTFANTINGARALTVSSSGGTTFSAAIGSTTPLASLTINAGTTGEVKFDANTTVTGNIAATARNIKINADVVSTGGDISLVGDAGTPVSGTFHGVHINGSGIEVKTLATNLIAGANGAISIQGRGGAVSSGTDRNRTHGVYLQGGAAVSAGGMGNVSVTGIGGASTVSNNSTGVLLSNSNSLFDISEIRTAGGSITVTGTGGGTSGANDNHGVSVRNFSRIAAGGGGNVNVTGTTTDGTGNAGVIVNNLDADPQANPTAAITSAGGDITITGTGSTTGAAVVLRNAGRVASGGSGSVTVIANSLIVDSDSSAAAGSITAGSGGSATATVRPRTAGTLIDLGGADVLSGSPLTLGLSTAEIARITAGTLVVGSSTAGGISLSQALQPASGLNLSLLTGAGLNLAAALTTTAAGSLGGDLSVTTANGAISQSASLVVGGRTTLTTGSGNITLLDPANLFSVVPLTISSSGLIQIVPCSATSSCNNDPIPDTAQVRQDILTSNPGLSQSNQVNSIQAQNDPYANPVVGSRSPVGSGPQAIGSGRQQLNLGQASLDFNADDSSCANAQGCGGG